MERQSYVYILASKPYGTLYTGVTSDLPGRISEHLSGKGSAFTAKYNVKRLVWFETFSDIETAIIHEKRIKRWRRDWKIALIERLNPHWQDLSANLWN
ncbi:MAG: GIY-YIG nuclease family protein [Rhodospirillales bacterium]